MWCIETEQYSPDDVEPVDYNCFNTDSSQNSSCTYILIGGTDISSLPKIEYRQIGMITAE